MLQASVGTMLLAGGFILFVVWFVTRILRSGRNEPPSLDIDDLVPTNREPRIRDSEPDSSSARRTDRSLSQVRPDRPVAVSVSTRAGGMVAASWRWYAKSEPFKIGTYAIQGGMVYVGEKLPSIRGRETEPALIRPGLRVGTPSAASAMQQLSYWPSYSNIEPSCRATYLEWLATGRRDPTTDIGYVFLFFYGLERRVLHDMVCDPSLQTEVPAVRDEVERLLRIYSTNGAFKGYASRFLGVLGALGAASSQAVSPPGGFNRTWEVPLDIRLGLGRIVVEGRPLPAEWAFAWAWSDPETRLRTPAERCPEEVRDLFLKRYAQVNGDGLVIKPNKTRLVLSYTPASASFGGEVRMPLCDVPDVTALRSVASQLRALLDGCVSEIEPYSRWLGRRQGGVSVAPGVASIGLEGKAALPGFALLPPEILARHEDATVASLRTWLRGCVPGNEPVVTKAEDLLACWPLVNPAKPTKAEFAGLAQFLQKLGFGIEPDPRFDGTAPGPAATVVLFPLPPGSPATPSPEYTAGALLMNFAVPIAAADGVSPEETRFLIRHVESSMQLAEPERARLRAHLARLLTSPPNLASLGKRVEKLGPDGRSEIAEFLVAIAGADGRITPQEIAVLTKAYALLGLEPNDVYKHIHAFTATASTPPPAADPIVVAPATERKPGFRIPPPPVARRDIGQAFSLDMRRVEAKIAESAAVSSLLAGIFVDDEETPSPAVPGADQAGLLGLDAAHSAVLRELVRRAEWPRPDWEQLCARYTLLPDGAMETINDAVFERHDTLLVEGDDPFQVDLTVAKEIEA